MANPLFDRVTCGPDGRWQNTQSIACEIGKSYGGIMKISLQMTDKPTSSFCSSGFIVTCT